MHKKQTAITDQCMVGLFLKILGVKVNIHKNISFHQLCSSTTPTACFKPSVLDGIASCAVEVGCVAKDVESVAELGDAHRMLSWETVTAA